MSRHRPRAIMEIYVIFVMFLPTFLCRTDDLDIYEYEPVEIVCPECKKFNNLTCHIEATEGFAHCSCPVCITKCPIQDNPCPKGTECVLHYIGCNFPPCSIPSAKCVPFKACKRMKCRPCKTGYVKDHNGCQTCLCNDPCKELECKQGQICAGEIESGADPTYHCKDVDVSACPPCIKNNNMTCHLLGQEKNHDGCLCPICITLCPVEDNPCRKNEECVMDKMDCNFAKPCSLESAKCVPFSGCRPSNCTEKCQYGYLEDHNGCETCLCSQQCKELGCTKCKVTSSPGRDKVYSCID